MRKYWAAARAYWQTAFEYRANMIGHVIARLILLIALIFLWRAIFAGREFFGPYTFKAMVGYFILVKFLHFANRGNVSRRIADKIKNGEISMVLLKPWSYPRARLAMTLAERFFQLGLETVVVAFFLILTPQYLDFSLSRTNLLPFLFSLGLALMINFLLNLLVASVAFWIQDVRLFHNTFFLTVRSLAGFIMPLDLFPAPLDQVTMFLPFSYLLYVPIKIYQRGFSSGEAWLRLGWGLIWAWVLALVARFVWRRGLKRYEAVGQ